MLTLTKLLLYIGYVPKSWLDTRTLERDNVIQANKLYDKLLNITNPDKNRLKKWSETVRKEGNHTCDICSFVEDKSTPKDFSGKNGPVNFLTAHHLYDKNIHPSLMYVPENGVCLCNKCHNSFHSKYTQKSHCTPKMYEMFKHFKQGQLILGIRD